MKKSDVLSNSGSTSSKSITTTSTSPSLTSSKSSSSGVGSSSGSIRSSSSSLKTTGTKPPLLSKSESSTTITSRTSPTLPSTTSTIIKKSSTIAGTSKSSTTPTLTKGLSTPNLPTTKRPASSSSTSSTSKLSSTTSVSKGTPTATTASSSTNGTSTKTLSRSTSNTSLTSSKSPTLSTSTVKTVSAKKPPVSNSSRPTSTTRTLSGTLSSQPPKTNSSSSKTQSATSFITSRSKSTTGRSATNLREQLLQEQEQEQEQELEQQMLQQVLPQQLTVNTPFEEFDPVTSPEFENVAKEFILLDDEIEDEDEQEEELGQEEESEEEEIEEEFDNENIIDLDGEEEIFEEEEIEEQVLLSSNIINLDDDDIKYDTDDNTNSLKNTQTLYSNGNIQVPDTIPMDIPNSNGTSESKPIEIKKSSSWMSSFFTKITKSTTSMISTSLSSSSTTTTNTSTSSVSPLVASTENIDPNSLTNSNSNNNNNFNQPLNLNGEISPQNSNNIVLEQPQQPQQQPQQPQQQQQPQPQQPILSNSMNLNNNNDKNQLKSLPPPSMMYGYNNSNGNMNNQYQNQPMNHSGHMNPYNSHQNIQHSNPLVQNHHHNPHQQQHQQHHNHPQNNNNINRYSQSFQYKMQPHNQPGGLALLPFTINSFRAISIFQDWYKSLWFAPTDFKEKIEPSLKIYKYFVPYYVFSCVVHSVHSGKVGFLKPDDPNQQQVVVQGVDIEKKKKREVEEIEWMNGSTNPYTQSHNDILIYAPVMHLVDSDPPIYQHSKEINDWRIDNTEPFHSQHPQLIYPNFVNDPQQSNLLQFNNQPNQPNQPNNSFYDVENSQLSQLPLVISKLDWDQAWVFAENKIKKNEIYGNDSKLKRDYQAHLVKDVETETKFENISYRTIYSPIYKLNYKYDGKDYSFIVNGQTGKRYSQNRPFGVGSIKTKAIKILTGGVFSSEKTKSLEMDRKITNNGIVKGSDLNDIDQIFNEEDGQQIKLYQDDHYYLMLPNSDQFLLLKTTGYCILRNSSKNQSNIKIQSHKRMTDEIGGTCILEPNETQTFAYRGSWCIEILEGDYESLELIKVETNSGGDKSFGDLLMQ